MSLVPNKPRNNDSICYPIIQTDDCQYQYTQITIDDSDCKSMKDGCMATHRMINALIYYSKNQTKRIVFRSQCTLN